MGPRELLIKGLEQLSEKCGEGAEAMFMRYLAELKKWNRVFSITAIRDDRDVVINHFLDSALYLKGLDSGVASIADIGSGGGFPGIPMKILRPDLEVCLVEPSRKKASFLRTLTGRLGLSGVTVIEKRMEDLSGVRVNALVTRALFSVKELREGALPLLYDGGRLVLSKGARYKEELRGLDFDYEVLDIDLPFSDATRHIIVIRI